MGEKNFKKPAEQTDPGYLAWPDTYSEGLAEERDENHRKLEQDRRRAQCEARPGTAALRHGCRHTR